MRNVLGPHTVTGYCTNVFPGETYDHLIEHLRTYATTVKPRISPDKPMGVGLWISADAARTIHRRELTPNLFQFMQELGLFAYTVNGFPYGDFHQHTVKHRVYEPDWATQERLEHTVTLADVLSGLLDTNTKEGSISTLPLGWAHKQVLATDRLEQMVNNLAAAARHMHRIEQKTGKLLHLDLEPEPGCALQSSGDIVALFESQLDHMHDNRLIRRHIRVCHDVCHAAVMFEEQATALENYRKAGIQVGKIQLSSAVEARFSEQTPSNVATQELNRLIEARYLHQTVCKEANGNTIFYEDLPKALASRQSNFIQPDSTWRVHLHIPLFLETFGSLHTTQHGIHECLAAIKPEDETHHFEIETYAWDVLPSDLKSNRMADDIANELAWFIEHAAKPSKH